MPPETTNSASLAAHYKRMMAGRNLPGASALEGMPQATAVDLSNNGIKERTETAKDTLRRIVEKYLNNDPRLHELVDKIVKQGDDALRKLGGGDWAGLANNSPALEGLEAIVRTDGSRPSFLIVNGAVDRNSSPLGTWEESLQASADQLQDALSCIGRIDVPGTTAGFTGTGFLIQDDLILTNRHVLQVSAKQQNDGTWRFADGAAIDFGHELGGQPSVNRRRLKRVVFSGSKPIDFYQIDHKKLDLALIELEKGDASAAPRRVFGLDLSPAWRQTSPVMIYTIGYPGSPVTSLYPPTLLEQLFQSTYGHKRLAPGEFIPSQSSVHKWTLAHDATTLGGNSGSIMVVIGQEGMAAGLHYGGRTGEPRENWGHLLSGVLRETDGQSAKTLYEVLKSHGVSLRGTEPPAGEDSSSETSPQTGSTALGAGPLPGAAEGKPAQSPATSAGRDWRRGVTLAMMKPLTPVSGATRMEAAGLEAAGDRETAPAALANRRGYATDFLDGWDIPLPMPGSDMRQLRRGGNGVELKYQHFSVIMSASRRLPLITACNINGADSRRLPRISTWSYDGRLDKEDQWGNELYLHNDVDRGHMVRREDPVWGPVNVAKTANVDTFHYTNSCPQMAGVNQVIWLGLEDYILNHTREDNMRVSVFTGPIFTPNDLPYRGALIPKAFWKIVAFLTDDERPSATAYRVSQARELEELEFVFAGYRTFQISVQQVMDETGIDFEALIPFDGFSQHERVHGVRLTERLESLDQIRV